MKMEVRRWRRKTWLLAKYFELAVPMMFTFLVGLLTQQRKISLWLVMGILVGFVYLAALREIIEATWRWQALDWLAGIEHRLTQDELNQLEMQANEPDLNVIRICPLMLATMITVLAFGQLPVWNVVARVVIAVVVGLLVLSHLLMVRLSVREEMATIIKHSP